ncbi:MAG: class I SAM-dependent methyltransferase [Verrucomicrobiales bacterium]|nr:class I SAM-dependent methyltransferase [Verrucomicrobiales bacterium]
MPRPDSISVDDPASELYRGASGTAYHEDKRALAGVALDWVQKLRSEKFQPWVRESDTVFELGVGSGWNLARLRCARRIGCDAAGFLADRLRALGIEFHGRTNDIPDGCADVVICHQTLEHLLEPVAALRELARIVKPGGRLILHVPWEVERRYARFDPKEPNHHLYHWNAQNLGNLMTVLGWTIDRLIVRRYGYDRFAAHLAARLRAGEAGFRTLRALMVAVRPLREVEWIGRR